MKSTSTLAGVTRLAPSLVVALTFVTGATFGAGLLFATAFGDYLPEPTPATAGDGCSSGCPAMLPCGMPLSGSDFGSTTCEFPEK
jgi:hypothetical protein